MEISLPKNIEQILRDKVSQGIFSSLEEALTFAVNIAFLRDEKENEKEIPKEFIDKVNEMIDEGIKDIENGRYRDGFDVMEDLMKKYA